MKKTYICHPNQYLQTVTQNSSRITPKEFGPIPVVASFSLFMFQLGSKGSGPKFYTKLSKEKPSRSRWAVSRESLFLSKRILENLKKQF